MMLRVTLALLLAIVGAVRPVAAAPTLANGRVRAEFGARGLVSLTDLVQGRVFGFVRDEFVVKIDGATSDSAGLRTPHRRIARDRITFTWTSGPYRFDVVYELRGGWSFLSKQILVTRSGGDQFRVGAVSVFRAGLTEDPTDQYAPSSRHGDLLTGDYGLALRFRDSHGLLVVVQNPFLKIDTVRGTFSAGYEPDMEWRTAYGPFASDRGLVAPYRLVGRKLPASMLPEWELSPTDVRSAPGLDEAEIDAFTGMVRAFVLDKPDKPLNVFVGWCANDYQIDVATADGRAEYKRLMDRAEELGAQYVLYAPSNSDESRREESVDDWSWEHVLWLGLGQQIRRNTWDPASGPLPPSIVEMLDYARRKRLKLLAYVYPVMPFAQNPEWLATRAGRPGKQYGSLGVRSLQDWLIAALVAFHRRTGIGGYAFDHTFLAFDGTSRYAQWWGWRRVMEELRRRVPDIVIDGRQAYHRYGPWSWLAGSYPHPTADDEQPESFAPFPDLHFDRVSADRERYTAYRYRNYEFAPSEIVPGFATHQTSRSDDTGSMPETKTERGVLLNRFRARDWDFLGWRYSLLSSIAVGGWNNVVNMIPARDPEEFQAFSREDRQWFHDWLQWTVTNKEFLRHTRTILGQPAIGKVDGTSMIVRDRGYVFLFNPNGRKLSAEFALDATIGVGGTGPFALSELYPFEGRRVGKPGAGVWTGGDRVSIPMDGGSAKVLQLEPAPPVVTDPVLFNAPGSAALAGGVLSLTGVRGEMGTGEDLIVLLPTRQAVTSVRLNDRELSFSRTGEQTIAVKVRFDGPPFRHYQQVGAYDPDFTGGSFAARLTIPKRVFDQLAARRRAWPIPWTPDDYRTTWLAPERLLLFVQIAEPDAAWEASLTIDGRAVELMKAYSAVHPVSTTFVGFYAEVSLLSAGEQHSIELQLPALAPGRFQGVFLENIEAEYTDRLAP